MACDTIPDGPVHFSRLKKIGLSPAHYLAASEAQSASQLKGSATHSVLLGGKRVVVYEDGVRNPRAQKWIDFQAANDGALIVIPSEAAIVTGMRKAIEAHPRAMALLDGIREQLIEWETMGRKCAGTPDVVHLEFPGCVGKVVVELKTSKTSSPWSFPWECKRYGYVKQVGWYRDGVEKTLAYPAGAVTSVFIVAVESTPPHPVTVFHVDERALNKGRMEWRGWMERLLECERSGEFPAYTDTDVTLGLDDDLDLDWDATGADEVAA
jgi:hypothetical protein